jgi:hypothetical protein
MADEGTLTVALVVFDTGPLITLAAAESLDYLKLPNVPVVIPDAVFYEATAKFDALGAQTIQEWVLANLDVVRIAPTSIFSGAQALLGNETIPAAQRRAVLKDMGERAALEVIGAEIDRAKPTQRALLVVEDNEAARVARLQPEIIPLSTTDFLKTLEEEGRINSADAVLDHAQDVGRSASRIEILPQEHERGVEAVRQALARRQLPNPANET